MARLIGFIGILLLSASASADVVRVAVTRGPKVVVEGEHIVITGGAGEPIEAEGRFVLEAAGQSVSAGHRNDTKFIVEEATGGALRLNGVAIIGGGEVAASKGEAVGIDVIDLERYVASVVGAEMPPSWPAAALEAQSVAARTYVLSRRRMMKPDQPYDVDSSTHSQVYTGESSMDPRALAAVEATRGLVVLYGRDLAETYFFASCLGKTESAADAFGKSSPYLTPVSCEADNARGVSWSHTVSLDHISRTLRARGRLSAEATSIDVLSRTSTGRLATVAIHTSHGTHQFSAEELREAVGTSVLPSLDANLHESRGEITFTGRGAGHGVGLCQWGAKELAQRGLTAIDILRHYYPGTLVAQRPAETPRLTRERTPAVSAKNDPLAALMPP